MPSFMDLILKELPKKSKEAFEENKNTLKNLRKESLKNWIF